MGEVIPVWIPQETVNDDLVLIQQWKVADGQAVQSGQILVEVETSKSVFEITCPADGFVRLNAASDQEVPIGKVLCYVGETLKDVDASLLAAQNPASVNPNGDAPEGVSPIRLTAPTKYHGIAHTALPESPSDGMTVPASSWPSVASSLPAQSTRFSRQALARVQENGLPVSHFAGRGLVRSKDILCEVASAAPVSSPRSPLDHGKTDNSDEMQRPKTVQQFRSAAGVPFQRESLARSKRLETRVLSWSTQQAIRSSVTVLVPSDGRHHLQQSDCDAVEKITANMILSSAHLLRQFPPLNACCIDDQVMIYERVHIGYALDAGHGLKVGVLRDADLKTLPFIVAERQRLIAAYLNQSLLPADVTGATFTITDLSGSGVTTFDPIISEGQSAILGIGSEFSIGGEKTAFHLILSFDHRLVEGRTAAIFLNQLKDRATAYEQSLVAASASGPSASDDCCARCGVTVSAAAKRNHFLVCVAGSQKSSSLICTICLQGR